MKKVLALCVTLLMALLGGVVYVSATEEPAYEIVETVGNVEIRHYSATIKASVPMTGRNTSFRQLAGFIFGGNDEEASIAMTAPVQIDLAKADREMAFIMPAEYDWDSLPRPNDPTVLLSQVPARTVAVLRFSGRASGEKIEEERVNLEFALADAGLKPTGSWSLNQYDPPWIPGPARRNEIWVDVALPAE
ncbi:MAG: heme-binding protein [Pseudomonadota bacterium]